jgi:hypothetical protein
MKHSSLELFVERSLRLTGAILITHWISSLNAAEPNLNASTGEKSAIESAKVEDGAGWAFSLQQANTAPSRTKLGSQWLGEVSSDTGSFVAAKTFRTAPPLALQVGVSAQNTHFSGSSKALRYFPKDLSSITLSLGASYDLDNKWTIGALVAPGIYSDFRDLSLSDVNMAALFGATYMVNPKLTWKFGLAMDLWNDDLPVLPFIGVIWKFAEHWTLQVDVLTPRLEWEIDPDVTLFTAVSYQGSTYRVARDFDRRSGLARTGNDRISFTETRVGGGVVWKIIPAVQAEFQGGVMLERELDFQEANHRLRSRPAPYFQVAFNAGF